MQKTHSNHPELACRMPSGKEKRFKDFIKPYAMVYAVTVLLALAGVFCGLVPYFVHWAGWGIPRGLPRRGPRVSILT